MSKFIFAIVVVAGVWFLNFEAHAQWQAQKKGGYTYFVSGTNIALPDVKPNWFYYKIDRGNGAWEFYHPIADGDWTVFYADGRRMFMRQNTKVPYQQVGCDLGYYKQWFNERYSEMTKNANSDFAPYYIAVYQEADILLRTCKAMHGG